MDLIQVPQDIVPMSGICEKANEMFVALKMESNVNQGNIIC